MMTMKTKFDIPLLKKWGEEHVLEIFYTLGFYPTDYGRYLKGQCPIPYHSGDADNTGAFTWSYDMARWGCWTHQCHEHTKGDIFGFIQAMKECNFGTALHFVNNLMHNGFAPEITVKTRQVNRQQSTKQIVLNKDKLKHLKPDWYFTKRGIKKETLNRHQVGYWELYGTFMNKRAIVPLFNQDSELVGFSGRTIFSDDHIKEYDISKWIHALDYETYQTEHFAKSNILYNLDKCINIVKEQKVAYIVEGPIDLWHLEEAGIRNVVATLGLGLSIYQTNLLVNSNVEKLIICYDNDKAGQEAALKLKNRLSNIFCVEIKMPSKKDFGEMSEMEIKKELC